MRIGIDVRMYHESGNGTYIRNLVRELVRLESSHTYVLFCLLIDESVLKDDFSGYGNVEVICADYRWYTFAEQLSFCALLYKERLDLMHFTHFNVCIFYFRPFVVTIHDLTHFDFKMIRASTLSPVIYAFKHMMYSFVFWYAVNLSKRIITVSKYVAHALSVRFPRSFSKTTVIYESGGPLVMDVPEYQSISVLSKHAISGPYFFYVGNAHPHKNLDFLIESFSLFCQDNPNVSLVLGGKESQFWNNLKSWGNEQGYLDNVVFTGFLDQSELDFFYANAIAYVFPSLSEGFGLPLLEAMAHRCPVLSSDATSLPEIAGDAARYFNPYQPDSLRTCLRDVYVSQQIREQMIARGLKRQKQFSWRNTALQTLAVYSP